MTTGANHIQNLRSTPMNSSRLADTHHKFARQALALAIAAALAGTTHAEQARGSSEAKPVDTLEDVIVTARKRTERVIDVPLAVSVVDSKTIEAKGVARLADLELSIPGLSTVDYGPGFVEFVQIRGISDFEGRATVGKYFDETPMNFEAAGVGMDVRFIDMERVEVLRGPQPTLYGDSSEGGTIRYIPAKPSLKEQPSGEVYAEGSSLTSGGNGWLMNGHVDSRLGADWLGVRLAAGYEKDAGWIHSATTGGNEINKADVSMLRATVLARPTDNVELTLLWQHERTHEDNNPFGNDGVTHSGVPTFQTVDYDIAEAVLRVNLGFAELVETPAYLGATASQQYDLTPYYVPVLALFGFPPGYVTSIGDLGYSSARIKSNQIRLVSKDAGAWSWSTGFDYKEVDSGGVVSTPTAPNQLPFAILAETYGGSDKIWALWGELGYAFSQHWQATLGMRYYHDKTDSFGSVVSFGFPSTISGEATFTSTNPRLNLSYKIDADHMVYFNVAKGFRGGGFNASYASQPTFQPETLWTYELGSKGTYLDRKLDLELSLYYNDWKNVQTLYSTPLGLSVISNGGLVKGIGADAVVTWRAAQGLQLGATIGWNNLEFKENPIGGDKLPGDPPDFAVRQSWTGFVDYRKPVWSGANLYGRVDYQHAGPAQVTLRLPAYNQITKIPGRSTSNLRLGVDFGRYDVSLFANNIANDRTPIVHGPFGVIAENVEQRPRQIGVALRAKF
jgi:iron complex outermembrane receptor protein